LPKLYRMLRKWWNNPPAVCIELRFECAQGRLPPVVRSGSESRMQQELAVPFRAKNRGVDEVSINRTKIDQCGSNFLDCGQLHFLIAHDAALPHTIAPSFELRFNQDD